MRRVVIAVCTYQRPKQLQALLLSLEKTNLTALEGFDISLLVVDNDLLSSARSVVESTGLENILHVNYIVEARRGLASVRNAALEYCVNHDYLIFLDDDELVHNEWLVEILTCAEDLAADFVIGPVRPIFPENVPRYYVESGLFFREELSDRSMISTGNTGNSLLRMSSICRTAVRFREDFSKSGGEDVNFFSELSALDCRGFYAAKAIVYEPVAVERLSVKWLLYRRYRFGTTEVLRSKISGASRALTGLRFVIIGLARIVASVLVVPLVFIFSPGRALRYSCAGARGLGYILGVVGVNAEEY